MTIRKFVHKPLEIEAIQLTPENWDAIEAWSQECGQPIEMAPGIGGLFAWVPTSIGTWRASEGNWIIRADDEFDAMTAQEFAHRYQEAGEFHPATEQAILAGLLWHPETLAMVTRTVRVDDFTSRAHQEIYRTICALYAACKPVDPVSVAAALDRRGLLAEVGGAAYLAQLTTTATA